MESFISKLKTAYSRRNSFPLRVSRPTEIICKHVAACYIERLAGTWPFYAFLTRQIGCVSLFFS